MVNRETHQLAALTNDKSVDYNTDARKRGSLGSDTVVILLCTP